MTSLFLAIVANNISESYIRFKNENKPVILTEVNANVNDNILGNSYFIYFRYTDNHSVKSE